MSRPDPAATDDLWQAADALFDQCLDLSTEERAERLAAVGDPAVRELVERLLAAEATRDSLLDGESPAGRLAGASDDTSWVGRRIGAFRAVAELGRGGMAVVYLAHRVDADFEQEVAIKVLRRAAETRDLLARFRRERQILAASDHPGMARILDGGETEDGRPYLVMERVQGERIDEHCEARRLGLRERLRLFLAVARTVADAHRRLVIHRDIKPSNILVTADGHPKLLDFGIAKLLEPSESAGDQTMTHGRLMTPAYAAPEQIEGNAVTTGTDVYQLGLLLYELLTGSLPYSTAGSPAELALRISRQPPRPGSEQVTEEAASARSTTLRELRRALRGDLDAILSRALAKDPEDRYGSVDALIDDLERQLEDRPVRARSSSLTYRIGSTIRRYRGAVATATLVCLLLLIYALSMSWQARRLAAERDRANRAAAAAEETSRFLTSLFLDSDPTVGRRADRTAQDLLDRGVERLAEGAIEDPLVAARLRATIGEVYGNLSRNQEAAELLGAAASAMERELGVLHDETLRARQKQIAAIHYSGDLPSAEALAQKLLGELEKTFDDDHLQVTTLLDRLGEIAANRGDLGAAETFNRRALEGNRRREGEAAHPTLTSKSRLASILHEQGRLREAEELLREILAGYRELLGADHPAVLTVANRLAIIARLQGRVEEAAREHENAYQRFTEVLGADHPVTHGARSSLAAIELARGNAARATELIARTVAGIRAVNGDEHPMTLSAQLREAGALDLSGRWPEAESLYRGTVEVYRRTLGPDSPYTISAERQLLRALRRHGRASESGPRYAELVRRAVASLGTQHTTTAQLLFDAACQALAEGRRDEARRLLQRAAEGAIVLELEDDRLETLRIDDELAQLLTEIERRRRAEGFVG